MGRDAAWVNTGQPLPEPFDAVIMVEKVHEIDGGRIEIRSPAHPWQHVRKVGEDIIATQLLFPQNHQLRPYDVGSPHKRRGFLGEGLEKAPRGHYPNRLGASASRRDKRR